MTINPNDYDPNELRGGTDETDSAFLGSSGSGGGSAAGGAGGGVAGGGVAEFGPMDAGEVGHSNQYRELFLLERTTGGDGMEKPYLSSLPQSYAAELVIFEWLEFLVDRTGFRRTLDVLRYYRSIDWLTDETERKLREYLQSFDDGNSADGLDRDDHLQSLVYVARLAAMD